ncbi:MAG: hypothetical protein HYZ33_02485 [Ignavibacteriales bacterium]|nr:hypothetical protein [Ignavibacteriales bacterium]
MKGILMKTCIFTVLFFVVNTIVLAQTFDFHDIPTDNPVIGIGFDKPFFSDKITSSSSSGVYHLRGNIPITPTLNLLLEIPYTVASYEQDYWFGKIKFDNNGLGNLVAAFQIKPESTATRMSFYTIGMVLPTGQKDAAPFGVLTNMYLFQQYLPNSMGFYFNYAYHNINPEGFAFGLELGPNFIIPTKGTNSELELFAHYGMQGGYNIHDFFFNIELLGIATLTSDVRDFSDRFSHSLTFGTQWKISAVTPELYYRIFVEEDTRKIIDGVLGLGISVSLK